MSCVGDIGGTRKKFDAERYRATSQFPYETSDAVVLGPDVIATKDGNWIQWRGAVYARVEAIIRDATE